MLFRSEGEEHSWTVTTFLVCDADGMAIVGQESTFTHGKTSSTMTRLYDPPMLVVPPDPVVGSTWTVATTITNTAEDGTETEQVIDRVREVTEEISTTVEGGTWDALHVVETEADGTVVNELYLGSGVGTIRSNALELTGFTRFD